MFKIKCSKSKDQQTITIKRNDLTDLTGGGVFTLEVYQGDLGTAINTYALSAGEITAFLGTGVEIPTVDLLLSSAPDDDFYTIYLDVDGTASDPAGVGITLEATAEVFSNQGSVNVYSQDYRIDNVLMTAFMLLNEMNAIEDMDVSLQKRVDFTTRQALLKEILNY